MGNKLGWIIAGVLLAGLVGYLLSTVVFPSPDKPTIDTTRLGVLELHAPKTPVNDVLGEAPSGEGNAGDDYAAAAAFYRQHKEEFEEMYDLLQNDSAATLDIKQLELGRVFLEKLAPAASKQSMTYTFVHTPKELKVTAFADGANDFENLSRALQCLIEHYDRTQQPAEAAEPARAMFIMGWHLMNERARFLLVASGMEYQDAGGQTLLKVYKDAGDGKKLQAMESYLGELVFPHKLTMDKQRIVWNFNAKPGDVFNIIENDKDRMWRIEGTLALGMLKFRQKGHRGNMRKVEQLLTTAQADDDELIRAAADVAQNCTSEQITSWQQ
ncbi:MAG: hypothetical protein JXA11_12885 [Phycisphaerae bacterium]|nr:hypothetical protein [Phycisphaerae bacterium]